MPDDFPTTHWSLVLAAQDDGSNSAPALAALCESYRVPMYAYFRRRSDSVDDAQDLVQGFFLNLIEKRHFDIARPEAGRFRAFLLYKANQYLLKQWGHDGAQKRGGRKPHLQLDLDNMEHRYASATVDTKTPEEEYEKRWAMTVVERAMHRLADDMAARGKSVEFEALRPILSEGTRDVSYKELAARLETTEPAVKSSVYRLRRRLGRFLREEIGQTVRNPADIEEELRYLFSLIS